MPDERIVLSYDPTEAIAGAAKANKAIEDNEKTAEKAGLAIAKATEQNTASIVSITERSLSAQNRMVQNYERKAAIAGSSPGELRMLEKERLLNSVSGNQEAINRVTVAYEKQEMAARKAAEATQLQSAITASRQAAKGADEFAAALNRVNAAAQKERESIEQGVRVLERRAAVAGKSSVQRLAIEANQAISGLSAKATPEQVERFTAAHAALISAQQKADDTSQTFGQSIASLAGRVGLAIGAFELFRKVVGFGTEAVAYAARTELLGVALQAVAKANGVAESTTNTLEQRLKSTGIVTQDARQSLAKLIAAQVDYTKAAQLARAAQDLGRVAGISSSDAFDKLTHAIVTQQPELLRMLGLNVNLQREFELFAKKAGRTAETLGEFEKRQITVNAVLQAAAGYAGVYEKSLDTAGGQMLSLQRYVLEAKDAFGREFLPELANTVKLLTWIAKTGEEAGSVLAKAGKIGFAPWYTLRVEIEKLIEEKRKLFDPNFDTSARKEAEAANELVRIQKVRETTSKVIREQDELRERAKLAQLEAEKKRREELLRLDERAADFRRSGELHELHGLDQIALKRKQAMDEFGKTPKARADIEKGTAAERAKYLLDFDKKRLEALNKTEASMAHGIRELGLRQLEEQYKENVEIAKLDEATRKTNEARELAGIDARKESELRLIQETTGKNVIQRLAAEEKVFAVEQEYALKTFAVKAEFINKEANLRAALATTSETKDAILAEASARAQLVSEQTQIAIDAARETAAVRKIQIIQTEQVRLFDKVRSAADGVFDALITRTRSFGDLFKNLILQPFLTLIKSISSNAIATLLTGSRGTASAGGIGGLLGGLFSGGGGIARAGAPGGTGGFTGPVTGLSGMLGMGGQAGGGFGGGGGGIGAALGLNAGALALGGAGLGLFGAFKAGQSDNKALKFSAPVIGALSGLVGFGALASFFPALVAAGPAGWIAAAGIGAAIGIYAAFKKTAESKIVDKVKNAYGITIDKSFARSPLMDIIKGQFGGDIDLGIRSPMVKELLAVYRMQSNQSSVGSGLGSLNNMARGVSLSGYGGNVYQNPVNLPTGSYGYGGSLPSTEPTQPFQPDQRPIIVEAKLQIDGRDVVASVQRTNQASNGRRESAAVLSDPLLIFG